MGESVREMWRRKATRALDTSVDSLRRIWQRHSTLIMWLMIAIMTGLAAIKLGGEFQRLTLWPDSRGGAGDLQLLSLGVEAWFTTGRMYDVIGTAVYPPATYLLLWPLLGALGFEPARWVFAGLMVVCLLALSLVFVRESGADTRRERIFVVLVLLSMNATGVTIGMGQAGIYSLAILIPAALVLARSRASWWLDLLVAALVLVSLIKPTVSAPFFWLIIFLPRRWRPSVLVVAGYAIATWMAIALLGSDSPDGAPEVISDALRMGRRGLQSGGEDAYGNLHTWMGSIGLSGIQLEASVVLLALFGVWVYRNRSTDIWVLLGITGIFSRLWAYHRVYDDVLVLPAMIALFRIAREATSRTTRGVLAGSLLGLAILSMLVPARIREWPHPWDWMFKGEHLVVWLAMLAFLLVETRRTRGHAPAEDKIGPAGQQPD